MPRLLRDFDDVEPTTKRWFYIDYGPELSPNETIQVTSFVCTVVRGVDPSPQSHVLSSAIVVGTQVGAFCGNFLPGVTYSLEATISTNSGNVLPNNARVYCQSTADR
jgi:hypothetical protein